MKRFFSVVCILALLDSFGSPYLSPNEMDACLRYVVDNGEVTLRGGCSLLDGFDTKFYPCSSTDVVIPTVIDGYPVTRIMAGAFAGRIGPTSLIVPSSVRIIEDRAFSGCPDLKTVKIYGGTTQIGKYLFAYDYNLETVVFSKCCERLGDYIFSDCNCKKPLKVIIDGGVEYIPDDAFNWAPIKEIILPLSIKRIGTSSFCFCWALKHIKLPNSIVYIGDSAFCRTGLEEITIPASVTSLGRGVFEECKSLHRITFLGRPPTGFSRADIPSSTLVCCPVVEYEREWVGACRACDLKFVTNK